MKNLEKLNFFIGRFEKKNRIINNSYAKDKTKNMKIHKTCAIVPANFQIIVIGFVVVHIIFRLTNKSLPFAISYMNEQFNGATALALYYTTLYSCISHPEIQIG